MRRALKIDVQAMHCVSHLWTMPSKTDATVNLYNSKN